MPHVAIAYLPKPGVAADVNVLTWLDRQVHADPRISRQRHDVAAHHTRHHHRKEAPRIGPQVTTL
jgi:hypothetical protein